MNLNVPALPQLAVSLPSLPLTLKSLRDYQVSPARHHDRVGQLPDQRWNFAVFFGGSGRRLRYISLLALSQQRDASLRSVVCRDPSHGDCLDHCAIQNSPRHLLAYLPICRPSRLLFRLGHCTLSMSYISLFLL